MKKRTGLLTMGLLTMGLLFNILATSCYRMPTEGEVSVIPNTNNPTMIHQEQSPWVPPVDM